MPRGGVLLVHVDPSVQRLIQRRLGSAAGPRIHEAETPEDALAQLEREEPGIDTLVLGPGVPSPVQWAQRARSGRKSLSIVILSRPEECEGLRRSIQVAPQLGPDITCEAVTHPELVLRAVRESVERSRKLRRYRSTIRSIQPSPGPGRPEPLHSASSLYFERILDYAPIGIAVLDAEGLIQSSNPKAAAILKRREHEMPGMPLAGLFSDAEAERFQLALSDALQAPPEQGASTAVFERRSLSGERQVLEATFTRVAGQADAPGTLVLLQDITAQRLHEERLAEALQQERRALREAELAKDRVAFLSEATLTLLSDPLGFHSRLEKFADLMVPRLADLCLIDTFDEDGRLARVVSKPADPRRSEPTRALTRFRPPGDADFGPGRVLRTRKAEYNPIVTELMVRQMTRDPEHLATLRQLGIHSTMIAPILIGDELLGVATFAYTVDSGRRFGPDDLALGKELAHRAAYALYNSRLYRQAQHAIRSRDEFLAIASHELRTPLTPLRLRIQGLQRLIGREPLASQLPEVFRDSFRKSDEQLTQMADLIDTILDVSRIQAGELELELKPVDLAAVAREALARNASRAAKAECELRLASPESLVTETDPRRVAQVLDSLVSNALTYGAGKPVEIALERRDGRARLSVRDFGMGIAPEDQARIFARFERAVSAHHFGGLGLGLYFVKQVVQGLQGEIRVHSEPGQGATFTVELPLRG